jgi:predicted transcriptional regulator
LTDAELRLMNVVWKLGKDGRAFVYRPSVKREQEREKAATHLLRRLFDGSAEMLMLNLVVE